jgi:hypothetical protein
MVCQHQSGDQGELAAIRIEEHQTELSVLDVRSLSWHTELLRARRMRRSIRRLELLSCQNQRLLSVSSLRCTRISTVSESEAREGTRGGSRSGGDTPLPRMGRGGG